MYSNFEPSKLLQNNNNNNNMVIAFIEYCTVHLTQQRGRFTAPVGALDQLLHLFQHVS